METGQTSRRIGLALRVAIGLLLVTGRVFGGEPVFSTKWAMDDPDYAQQHSGPYSDDPLIRKSQQRREWLDASFQENVDGVYIGGGSALNNWSVGEASAGLFKMPTAWSSVRLGAIGMVAGGSPMGGAEIGLRLHTPTRLAPYVGLAGVLELSGFHRHISYHRYYYDSSGQVHDNPRWGYFPTGMAAIVPEAGISYWLSSTARLNLGASYYVTAGSQPDFLLVGMSMDFILRSPPGERVPAQYAYPEHEEDADPYFVPVPRPREYPPDPNPVPDPPPTTLTTPPARLAPPENPLPTPLSNVEGVLPPLPEDLPPTVSQMHFRSNDACHPVPKKGIALAEPARSLANPGANP